MDLLSRRRFVQSLIASAATCGILSSIEGMPKELNILKIKRWEKWRLVEFPVEWERNIPSIYKVQMWVHSIGWTDLSFSATIEDGQSVRLKIGGAEVGNGVVDIKEFNLIEYKKEEQRGIEHAV